MIEKNKKNKYKKRQKKMVFDFIRHWKQTKKNTMVTEIDENAIWEGTQLTTVPEAQMSLQSTVD